MPAKLKKRGSGLGDKDDIDILRVFYYISDSSKDKDTTGAAEAWNLMERNV